MIRYHFNSSIIRNSVKLGGYLLEGTRNEGLKISSKPSKECNIKIPLKNKMCEKIPYLETFIQEDNKRTL